MVLHKHVYGEDTRFYTTVGPFSNKPLEKWLGVIRRGTHQSSSEDSRWAYEQVSDLWPDIYPDSDSRYYVFSDKGSKYQENQYDQEQYEVLLVPHKNPRRLRKGDQIALIQLKVILKDQRISYFSLRTCIQIRLRLNGTWCRRIWTSRTHLA